MKILRIIKAKYKAYTQTLPDWALERKKICDGCMFNSAYSKKKGFRHWVGNIINFGENHCRICLCGIRSKCSSELEECSATPPKWKSLY